jgi:hypothetical protein
MQKASKAAADYRAGDPIRNCGLCGHFLGNRHRCEVVKTARTLDGYHRGARKWLRAAHRKLLITRQQTD